MELKEQVEAFITKYLAVHPEAVPVIADYALQTWQPRSKTVKYLHFYGEQGTGKTRASLVMKAICQYAFLANEEITEMALLEKINQGVCVPIFDIDYPEKAKIVKHILLNGSVEDNAIIWRLRTFNVFGYKVICSMRKFRDEAIEACCISVRLTGTDNMVLARPLEDEFRQDRVSIQQVLTEAHEDIPYFAL